MTFNGSHRDGGEGQKVGHFVVISVLVFDFDLV